MIPPPPPAPPSECVEAQGYYQQGIASWYGARHQGQATASGEAFDMNDLTAAHRTLPLGTRIRVTNLRNGKTAVLTVNDRGPFIRGRVLDVSFRAARDLDFGKDDLAPVRVETVKPCTEARRD